MLLPSNQPQTYLRRVWVYIRKTKRGILPINLEGTIVKCQ